MQEAIKSRGGNASNVNRLEEGMGQQKVGDIANRAAKGDRDAEQVIKMIKQAGKKGQKY